MAKIDFKVILLGQEDTGKSSLLVRFTNGTFQDHYQSTLGLSFSSKSMTFNDRTYNIGIWDTAGSERYRALTRSYYRNSAAAIVCYDILSHDSWKKAMACLHDLNSMEPMCKVYFCGTKTDLLLDNKRRVNYDDVVEFATIINNCKMIEVSSKTGENVDELFMMILQDYVNNTPTEKLEFSDYIKLNEPTKKKSKCCGTD